MSLLYYTVCWSSIKTQMGEYKNNKLITSDILLVGI